MSTTKTFTIPTVGRIVHFFPAKPDMGEIPYTPIPKAAIVTASSQNETAIALTVFPAGENPVALNYAVEHESKAPKTHPYWAWPEIK